MDTSLDELAGSREGSPAIATMLEELTLTRPRATTPVHDDSTSKIVWAARDNNLGEVLTLLDTEGIDVNTQDGMGYTALHHAAGQAHHAIISLLLERRASVNAQSYSMRETPLHMAAVDADPLTLQMLLAAGADPTIQNADSETPLHLNTRKGTKKTILMLLAAHANMHQIDYQGRTPLHRAAETGNLEVFDTLIKAGAISDIQKQDRDGRTPLHLATSLEITRMLLDLGAEIDQQDKKGKTALHLAADTSNKDKALALIQHGADQKIEDVNHDWPINIAITHDNDYVVSTFCEGLHIQREKEHNLASILALATHARLGNQSPLSLLPAHLLSDITRKTVLAEIRTNTTPQNRNYTSNLKSKCTSSIISCGILSGFILGIYIYAISTLR
jgi:ankyrin repeat protein